MPYWGWIVFALFLVLFAGDIVLVIVFLLRKRQAGARWKKATISRPRDGYRHG